VSTALYRRYRPDTFADVIGQEHVTVPLMRALDSGRINHAYLFSGPRGCGKTTSARILARCLNCEEGPTGTPCGVCDSCVALARGGSGSIDVIEIDAASHGGVDDARDLRERAAFAPASSRFKVYIIDEAHMVTPQGFNALLKIVEEPPEHVKFVFATTEPEKVIGTIRSRTHHYPFRLVPPARLHDYLEQLCVAEGVPVEPGVLSFVVRAGAGSVRDSLSVLDQLMAGSDQHGLTYDGAAALLGFTDAELLDATIDAFAAGDGASVFGQIERVIDTGLDPRRFVEDVLERFRDLIVLSAAPDTGAFVLRGLPSDQIDRMRVQAAAFGPGDLSRSADIVNAGLTEMTGATSPRLQLELIAARVLLPGAAGERGYAARLDRLERRLEVGGVPSGVGQAAASPGTGPAARPATAASEGPAGGARGQSAAGLGGSAVGAQSLPEPEKPVGHEVGDERAASRGGAGDGPGQGGAAGRGEVGDESAGRYGSVRGREIGQERGDAAGRGGVDRGSAATGDARGPGGSAGPGRQVDAGGFAGPGGQSDARGPGGNSAAGQHGSVRPSAGPRPMIRTGPAPADLSAGDGAPSGRGPGGLDVQALRRSWPDVLARIFTLKRTTWTFLSQHAQVQDYDGRRLVLTIATVGLANTFRSGIHAEIVRQALIDVLGVDVRVDAVAGGSGSRREGGDERPGAGQAGGAPGGPDRSRGGHPGGSERSQSARGAGDRRSRYGQAGSGHSGDAGQSEGALGVGAGQSGAGAGPPVIEHEQGLDAGTRGSHGLPAQRPGSGANARSADVPDAGRRGEGRGASGPGGPDQAAREGLGGGVSGWGASPGAGSPSWADVSGAAPDWASPSPGAAAQDQAAGDGPAADPAGHASHGGSSQSARATQAGHGSGPGARGPASGANTGESSRPAPVGRVATEPSTQHPAVDADIDDEDLISDDDEDLIALGEVGRPVIERVLGGTVIWSEGDELTGRSAGA